MKKRNQGILLSIPLIIIVGNLNYQWPIESGINEWESLKLRRVLSYVKSFNLIAAESIIENNFALN